MAFEALWIGTLIYAGIGVLLCMLLPFYLLRPENTRNVSKKEMIWLMIVLVSTTIFCLWLFWISAYASQMYPLISPERPAREAAFSLQGGVL